MLEQLTVIGLGLIGSSVVRAARVNRLAKRVVGYDISPEVRQRATALNLADSVAATLAEAVTSADLTIICVPVGSTLTVARDLRDHLKPQSIVSDVGSVKSVVSEALVNVLSPHVHIVPAHPVAGTEYSGPDAGFATLFQNRWCIITPLQETSTDAIDTVRSFWVGCGANVELMSPKHHDLVLAITSHVPHLIAYNIVGTAADLEEVTQSEVIKFSAGGFRDFTRIAASDPTMWRDIFLNNKEAVLEMLGRFSEDLLALQRMIRWGDGQGLFDLFTRTRAIRRSIIEQGQETSAPDFGRVQMEEKE